MAPLVGSIQLFTYTATRAWTFKCLSDPAYVRSQSISHPSAYTDLTRSAAGSPEDPPSVATGIR